MDQKEVLRASHTGVRFKGNSAQQRQGSSPATTAQLKPDHIAKQTGTDGEDRKDDQAGLALPCNGAGGKQHGNRRNGKADLLCQHSEEHHHLDMTEQKFQHLFHAVIPLCSAYARSTWRIAIVSAPTSSGPSCRWPLTKNVGVPVTPC